MNQDILNFAHAMEMQTKMLIDEICGPPNNGYYDGYDPDGNETLDCYENGKLIWSERKQDINFKFF